MKKIEKEFWISKEFKDALNTLARGGQKGFRFLDGLVMNDQRTEDMSKVTISWEEPGKKIEITEKQFWDIVKSTNEYCGASKLFRDMFGGGE